VFQDIVYIGIDFFGRPEKPLNINILVVWTEYDETFVLFGRQRQLSLDAPESVCRPAGGPTCKPTCLPASRRKAACSGFGFHKYGFAVLHALWQNGPIG
jgi:hypothetical protein